MIEYAAKGVWNTSGSNRLQCSGGSSSSTKRTRSAARELIDVPIMHVGTCDASLLPSVTALENHVLDHFKRSGLGVGDLITPGLHILESVYPSQLKISILLVVPLTICTKTQVKVCRTQHTRSPMVNMTVGHKIL